MANDINNIMNLINQGSEPSPGVDEENSTVNNSSSEILLQGRVQNNPEKIYGMIGEDVMSSPYLAESMDGGDEEQQKTIQGFLKNNLIDAPVNLGTGLVDVVTHPREYLEQAKDFYLSPDKTVTDKVLGTGDFFFTKPITGMGAEEAIRAAQEGEFLNNLGEHLYHGGTLTAGLALAPTGILKSAGKGVGAVAKGIDTALLRSKGQEMLNALKATREGFKNVASESILTKIDLKKQQQRLKGALSDIFNKYKINEDKFTSLVEKMEGIGGKDLSMMTPEEQAVFKELKPVLDDWDALAQTYKTAAPGNITEIITKGVRRSQDQGVNTTYQAVDKAYRDAGFWDLGQYVTKDGKPVTFPKNKQIYSAEEFLDMPKTVDLRNTQFEIPAENIDLLAEEALRNPLAKQFLEDYLLAKEGKLQRVSHGLADVQRDGVQVDKSIRKINKPDTRFSERAYGNASAENIAREWLDPDTLLNHAIRGMMRNSLLDSWWRDFVSQGKPIMNKYAKPEDVRYVNRAIFNDSHALKRLNNENIILKKLPEGANPLDYAQIDKYTLGAYRDLFFPEVSNALKVPKLVRDITTLFKQGLLSSGLYLFGNMWGGLHQFLTASNVNLFNDLTAAIRTRGALANDLALKRPLTKVSDTRLKATKGDNPLLNAVNATNRGIEKMNNYTGSNIMRNIDASMQNTFAELAAHARLRNQGVKFENRNLDWIKQNMSKEELYNTLNDIERMALIYGDMPVLPKWLLQSAEIGNPFFNWINWATESTAWLAKNHPIAFGYLQGSVLGNYAWDENLARAEGLGVSNPQSGKIYRMGKDGNVRVTETELIPELTTAKALQDPGRYFKNVGQNASVQWLLNAFDTKTPYGKLKERKDWGSLTPDFRKNVRVDENGMIKDNAEIDETLANLLKGSGVANVLNKTVLPVYYAAKGQQFYQPYNEEVFGGTGEDRGNPSKPYGMPELIDRAMVQYSHPLYYGVDDAMNEKTMLQAQKASTRSKAKKVQKVQDYLNSLNGGEE